MTDIDTYNHNCIYVDSTSSKWHVSTRRDGPIARILVCADSAGATCSHASACDARPVFDGACRHATTIATARGSLVPLGPLDSYTIFVISRVVGVAFGPLFRPHLRAHTDDALAGVALCNLRVGQTYEMMRAIAKSCKIDYACPSCVDLAHMREIRAARSLERPAIESFGCVNTDTRAACGIPTQYVDVARNDSNSLWRRMLPRLQTSLAQLRLSKYALARQHLRRNAPRRTIGKHK